VICVETRHMKALLTAPPRPLAVRLAPPLV
jgi:hypothetical protein